jgi:hypothetical protein
MRQHWRHACRAIPEQLASPPLLSPATSLVLPSSPPEPSLATSTVESLLLASSPPPLVELFPLHAPSTPAAAPAPHASTISVQVVVRPRRL